VENAGLGKKVGGQRFNPFPRKAVRLTAPPKHASPEADRHPHETRHSIDEELGWFDTAGIDFLSSIPASDGSPFTNDT
jgi:hypothetical protein